MLEWFLVNEQFGRVTNGLHWHVPNVYNVLMQGTPEQIERYVAAGAARRGRRRLRGHRGRGRLGSRRDRHAPRCAPTAGWRINGEKWFVTSGDVARVLIVMANVVDGADRLPTLFLIEPGAAGVEFVDNPKFTHNYPHGHPTIRFTDVEVERRRGDRRHRQRRGAAARAGSPRSGSGSPPTASARCGGCSRRPPTGRCHRVQGGAADHGLPGDLVPARGLRHRRGARAAAGAAGAPRWSTAAPIRS